MKIPSRPSLVVEVIAALREGIANGGWDEHLPGERQLSRDLQVSRPTLRQALRVLEGEGALRTQSRSRRKILRSATPIRPSPSRIVILTPRPLEQMESPQVAWVDSLRSALARLGKELQIGVHPRAFGRKGIRDLENLVRETPAAAWILLLSTEAMQVWFREQGLPVIVAGSCFRDDGLPSLDLDFRALGRHAAGILLARGHSQVGLLTRSEPRAGDNLTEVGFREAFPHSTALGPQPMVIRYDGSPAGLSRVLDRLARRAALPSAYLTVDFPTLLSLVTYLVSHDQIMGRDYSAICRDEAVHLDALIPSVAFYRRDQEKYGRTLLRMLLRLIREPHFPPQGIKMMPTFQSGSSIMPPNKLRPSGK